jgi:medium-chain acyl-[acyl-carrier-protein] hydrolase
MAEQSHDLRWFDRCLLPPDRPLRLICFAHAGASAFVFRDWQKLMPPAIGVVAIQLPGHGERMRECPERRIAPLLRDICAAALPFLDRPFALFGHSMGAVIAFELARLLECDHHLTARHLFVSGHRAPSCPGVRSKIHHLPSPAFISALKQYSDTLGGLLDDPEALELFLPILRADLELLETYIFRPGPPLSSPITVFGGEDDSSVPLSDLDEWRLQTVAACTIQVLPGDHFFVTADQHRVVRLIDQALLTGVRRIHAPALSQNHVGSQM